MAGRPTTAALIAALEARFEDESAERQRLWELCIEHPGRLCIVEADLIALRVRISALEDTMRTFARKMPP